MRRVKAIVQYDGRGYAGFQIQPNAETVEGRLSGVLSALYGTEIKVTASGRTDSGVHAVAQTVHFDVPDSAAVPVERVKYAAAKFLPGDIAILSAEYADADFHARYSCKAKTYRYRIIMSDVNLPLERGRAWICGYKLDIEKMKRAAKALVGEHDFKSFMSAGSAVKTTVREVTDLKIECHGNLIEITITANGFLYNMVRIIVGTLADIGRGKIGEDETAEILLSGDRERAGITAPPEGLYLVSAEY